MDIRSVRAAALSSVSLCLALAPAACAQAQASCLLAAADGDRPAVAPAATSAPRTEPARHADAIATGTALSGSVAAHEIARGESLASIAARYGVSAAVIARDNALKPSALLRPGTRLSIDHRHVVPQALDDGIVISVAQRMLFHMAQGRALAAYPVAAGRPGWKTPLGRFTVANLQQDKPWIVPPSIQAEMRREGKPVLTRVEPGPDNPLGRHWIGLSIPGIGIHGTNAPSSIYGLRSHGCVRLHPDDVAELFGRVAVGTPGAIVYHATLLAVLPDGGIFVEANPDAYRRDPPPLAGLRALADARGLSGRIDWGKVRQVVRERDGIAREVGLAQAAAAPGAPPSSGNPQ